ncbi:hypothetical protein VBH63_11490 [Kocuria rhizophila]|uniref:hypothetical protein n=1 Tax=Kocuria rhizophila TaxID=72000 RepID=UPI0037985ED6
MSYFNDSIKPLGILLFRYTRKRAGAGLRWAMRSPMRLAATAAVIVALAFGVHMLSKAGNDKPNAHPVASASATDDGLTWRQVEAGPLGADGQPTSDASPKASDSASEKPSPASSVPAPSKPKVNRAKADSTAGAFLRSYLSRREGDDQWKQWSAELTNEQLADQLAAAQTALDGRGDSTVTAVSVGKAPFTGAPKDTKIRWSRPVTATVTTETGQPIKLTYEVTAMKGDKGWIITDAVERGWTAAR